MGWSEKYWDDVRMELVQPAAGPALASGCDAAREQDDPGALADSVPAEPAGGAGTADEI